MRNQILIPIASAVIATSLIFAMPAQAEEDTSTITTEVYQEVSEETTTNVDETVSTDVYEDEAQQDNDNLPDDLIVEVEDEADVVTPDSFLYSFKLFIEEVRLFFTFDDEKKAELLTLIANERLLEADLMAEKGDLELVKELIKAYEEKIAAMEELIEENESVNEEVYESVNEDAYETVNDDAYGVTDDVYGSEDSDLAKVYAYKLKNIEALTRVYNKVPDHVKPVIAMNIKKAMEKRERHIAKKLAKMGIEVPKVEEQEETTLSVTKEEVLIEEEIEKVEDVQEQEPMIDEDELEEAEDQDKEKEAEEKEAKADKKGKGKGKDANKKDNNDNKKGNK